MENSTINIDNNTPIDMARNFIPIEQRTPAPIFGKNVSKKNKKEEEKVEHDDNNINNTFTDFYNINDCDDNIDDLINDYENFYEWIIQ